MSITQFGTYRGGVRGERGARGESGLISVDTDTLDYNSTTKHLSLKFDPNDFNKSHVDTRNPLTTDIIGYDLGNSWYNKTANKYFILTNLTEEEATWNEILQEAIFANGVSF